MEIDIVGFLRSHRLIPVGENEWHSFEIEHFADAVVADADGHINDIRLMISATRFAVEQAVYMCMKTSQASASM